MEQDAQADELYDFLYRDSGRISSYYAQMFGGKLSTFEKSEAERSSADHAGKASIHLLGYEGKHSKETQSGLKQTFDPHDLITSDVLAFLVKNNRLQNNVAEAAHGSLVSVSGTILFIDRSIMEMATTAFESLIETERKKPKHKRQDTAAIDMVAKFMRSIVLPSAFLLREESGLEIVGTLKDTGMEEPISTYYFKHGMSGLADVILVGIKETPSSIVILPEQQFFGAAQQATQALSELLFPKDTIRVTPIAMFRKL